MTPKQAHQYNIDAAQRELDQRNAEGEDVSHLVVCQRTAQIVPATKRPTVEEMVAAVQAHAIANFESGKGWDYISECWGGKEIAEEVQACRTVAGAIKKMGAEAAFHAEREAECGGGEW